jgi:hypothetical protein
VDERTPKSVSRIHPSIPRLAASVVPVAAAILLAVGGRRLGELTLLWGGVVLLLLAVSALLSYMLWNGQFPPRISPQGADLPAEEAGDTAAALWLLQSSLDEVAERVRRMEDHLGIDGDEE